MAYALLLTNKLSEVEREARRALALNPQYAEAHYIIGVRRFSVLGLIISDTPAAVARLFGRVLLAHIDALP